MKSHMWEKEATCDDAIDGDSVGLVLGEPVGDKLGTLEGE